jgi:predicted 3-demethylubiquinone-9 3-methyltransferase (glyoxalase superfamily)
MQQIGLSAEILVDILFLTAVAMFHLSIIAFKMTERFVVDGKIESINTVVTAFEVSYLTKNDREAGAEAAGRQKAILLMTAEFELEGQKFTALNGGPHSTFSPAISFVVNCETQEEVDGLWEKLSDGREKQRCAWLKDKYGVSWQIVPIVLIEMLQDRNPEKSKRVMNAMLQMDKIDVAALKQTHEQK